MRRSFLVGGCRPERPPAAGRCSAEWWGLRLRGRLCRRGPRLLARASGLEFPGRRRTGRGAPLPASPYSFVVNHHVFRPQGVAGVPDVVLRSPQALVPSSTSTTSLGPKAPLTYRTWCSAPRKPLFLRRQAPRLLAPRRRRRTGRGAPLPASPCSFVVKHHVFRPQGAADVPVVVLRSPLALVPSSSSTTSLGPKAPPTYRSWCSAPRKTLFLRRHAPRLWRRLDLQPPSHPKSDA